MDIVIGPIAAKADQVTLVLRFEVRRKPIVPAYGSSRKLSLIELLLYGPDITNIVPGKLAI